MKRVLAKLLIAKRAGLSNTNVLRYQIRKQDKRLYRLFTALISNTIAVISAKAAKQKSAAVNNLCD